MALNKLLILNENQLVKLLEDNGHREIASILKDKNIDGEEFLNLTEHGTRYWRLSSQQTKDLFSFISLVKKNPAMLIKATNQWKSPLVRRQVPKPDEQQKPPSKSNSLAKSEFKQKLGYVLSTNSSTMVHCSVPYNFLPNPERPSRPVPQMLYTAYEAESNPPAAQFSHSRTPELPHQTNPQEGSVIVQPKLKPLPTIPDQIAAKPKFRPPLATPTEDAPLEIYENLKRTSSIDGSYLGKNELERSYVNSSVVLEYPEEPRHVPAIQTKSPIETEPVDVTSKFKSIDAHFEVGETDLKRDDRRVANGNGYLELSSIRKAPTQQAADSTKLSPSSQQSFNKGSRSPTREPSKISKKIGKLFSKKKTANIQGINYENHMVNSEVSSREKNWEISIKNRPLPDVPKFETEKIPKKYVIKSHSDNPITTKNIKRTTTEPIISTKSFNQNNYSHQNLQDSSSDDENFKDQKVYENFPVQKASSSAFLQKQHLQLGDNLAMKLSQALKTIETPNVVAKKNFSKIKTPVLNESEDDQNNLYQNVPNKNSQLNLTSSSDKLGTIAKVYAPKKIVCGLKEEREFSENEYVGVFSSIYDDKYFKNTTRQGAKELLKNMPDGAFLFRPSEKYFMVLTLRYNGKCYNLGLERTLNMKIRFHADTNCISPEFENLRAFVAYFAKVAVTFRDVDNSLVEIYLKPMF